MKRILSIVNIERRNSISYSLSYVFFHEYCRGPWTIKDIFTDNLFSS